MGGCQLNDKQHEKKAGSVIIRARCDSDGKIEVTFTLVIKAEYFWNHVLYSGGRKREDHFFYTFTHWTQKILEGF